MFAKRLKRVASLSDSIRVQQVFFHRKITDSTRIIFITDLSALRPSPDGFLPYKHMQMYAQICERATITGTNTHTHMLQMFIFVVFMYSTTIRVSRFSLTHNGFATMLLPGARSMQSRTSFVVDYINDLHRHYLSRYDHCLKTFSL